MARKWMAGLLASTLFAGVLAGCGGTTTQPKTDDKQPATNQPTPAKQFKVGMVTDTGGLGDKSFNDSAHAGLKKAESDLKAKIAVIESKRQEEYEPNLATMVEQGMDLSWAIGYLMTKATENSATKMKDKNFAIIDSVVDKPNVASVVFKEEEGSFLMGIIAAKATKTKKVGFVGGMEGDLIGKFEAGFRAGVKAIDPAIEVKVNYTGVFDNPQKGKEAALAQYGAGVDVIYHASGACGIGVIEAAKEKNQLAIGVDSDQNPLAPDHVISSMMKRVDVAVFEVSKLASEGKFPGGKLQVLGLKENGVGPSTTTKWDKAPGAKELVDTWTKGIVDGKAKIPTDPKKFGEWQVPKL